MGGALQQKWLYSLPMEGRTSLASRVETGETLRLLQDARKGDREALDLLFARFAPFVRRVVALRGGPRRNPEDLDDLVQDALLRAYQGFDGFGGGPEDDFRAWLACCARCAVFDDYKRAKAFKRGGGKAVRAFSEWGSSWLTSSILEGREPSPSKIAMAQEAEERLHRTLLEMEERHRNVILYRKVCGMSYRQIADELRLASEGSARVMVLRALRRLREKLGLETG